MEMTRERKILLASMVLAVTGWVTAAVLMTNVGTYKLQAERSESNATNWKRQAGKAYTEFLKSSSAPGSATFLIPVGASIQCNTNANPDNSKAIIDCNNAIIYPPKEF